MADQDETEDAPLDVCEACGRDLGVDADRAYPIDDERSLCFTCAVARGGVYDGENERWVDPPDLSGLGGDWTTRAL